MPFFLGKHCIHCSTDFNEKECDVDTYNAAIDVGAEHYESQDGFNQVAIIEGCCPQCYAERNECDD